MTIPYGQKDRECYCGIQSLTKWEVVHIFHPFVQCCMVFDIRMEDLRQKAKLVAGGHMAKAPATIIFDNVVSRETVRIALMIVTLAVM